MPLIAANHCTVSPELNAEGSSDDMLLEAMRYADVVGFLVDSLRFYYIQWVSATENKSNGNGKHGIIHRSICPAIRMHDPIRISSCSLRPRVYS